MRALVIMALVGASSAIAAPSQFVFQGRLLDVDGSPLEGPHDLTVTLYRQSGAGAWSREFENQSFSGGFFTVTLGTDGSGVTLEEVTRGADPVVELGLAVDEGAEQQPRQPLYAAPRAEMASAVPASTSLQGTSCTGLGAVAFDITADALVVCGSAGVWQGVGGCASGTVPYLGECVPCGDAVIAEAGPLYFWPLDDGGSTAVDATGRKNGTYNGTISRSTSTPVYGSSGVDFSGSLSNYIRFDSFSPPQGDSTVMGWVQTTTVDAGIVSYAVSGNFNEWLPLYSPVDLNYHVKGTGVASGVAVNDNQWHHIAMSRVESTGVVTVFVDGVERGTVTVRPGESPSGGGVMVFAQEQDSIGGGFQSSQALNGGLDDVAMFASALDAAAIARLYHGQICE